MQYRCNTNHKSIRFSRKGTQLGQLFQGSFWKNRNFFKGVFIKEKPKRQKAKKASHFFRHSLIVFRQFNVRLSLCH